MFYTSKFELQAFLRNDCHVAWVLIQHVLVKCLFAAKFILVARTLGPQDLGHIGVALASLAIVESLSDTGLLQAVIQRKSLISAAEAGAVWTLQLARGILLFFILYFFSSAIASSFGISDAAPLIAVAALLPVIRGSVNPGYAILQRDRRFRVISVSESVISLIDLASTLIFLHMGAGAISTIWGSLMSDCCRSILSWFAYRVPMSVNVAWRSVAELGRYGQWIWSTSVLTVVLNQFDKVVVARWLGATQFGMYQTASRLAQMAVADVAIALGIYLFPTISTMHHSAPEKAHALFLTALRKIALISGSIAMTSIVTGPIFLNSILGPEWEGIGPILQLQCVSMWFGALIAVCVAYLKAIGNPKSISVATATQLLTLTIPSYWVVKSWGSVGMAALVAVSLSVSLSVMYYHTSKSRYK